MRLRWLAVAAAAALAASALAVGLAASSGGERPSVPRPPAAGPGFVVGAAPGSIPALHSPRLVPARKADVALSAAVVGIARRGEAHAYPVNLLSLHEVVNDRVGGEPVAVTWCPLCRTALGFSRRVSARTLDFEVSGLLRHRNLVLRDRQTGTLWPQLTAVGERGPLAGRRLTRLIVSYTSLGSWLREHPRTLVLPIRGDRFAARLLGDGVRITQYGAEDAGDPYSAYFQKAPLYLGRNNVRGISRTALVLGTWVRGRPVAVPVEELKAGSYEIDAPGGRVLVRWRPLEGDARAFLLRDGRREPLPGTVSYWFAWVGFNPRTAIRRPLPPVRLDLRRKLGRQAAFLRDFDYSGVYVGAEPDQIRAIDHPIFESPAEAKPLLGPDDLVIGLEHGGEAHAYPVKVLSLHEVANDRVGGLAVAVTWCPLCRTALGYERAIAGRPLRFGVSGYLYRANLILFDRETGSLWSQLLGGAITGPMRGRLLRTVPLVQTTWSEWLREHPRTRVLSVARDSEAEQFTRPFAESSDYGTDLSDSPYSGYASKVGVYFRRSVRGLSEGSLVLGLRLRGRAKAYPLVVLAARGAVDDELAGEPVLIVGDEDAISASAFSRRLGGRVLTFRAQGKALVDHQTGSRWSPLTGRAMSGPLAGRGLRRLAATPSYWFAWRGLYPRTTIYR
jgi:hypothetical protein